MQTTNASDAEQWLRDHGFPRPQDTAKLEGALNGGWPLADLAASRVVPVGRALVSFVTAGQPSRLLVLVYETGIWCSSEDLCLYARWREALGAKVLVHKPNISPGSEDLYLGWREAPGAKGLINQSPGHLFQSSEWSDAISLVVQSLLFGWGAGIYAEDGRAAAAVFDHDGNVCLWNAEDRVSAERTMAMITRPSSPTP